MAENTEMNGDSQTLVQQAKDKCRITWTAEETERTVAELVASGCAAIRFKVGIPDAVEFDFTAPGLEHRLFLNWCYYAWHDAEDDFERNYAADIAHARRKWEVENAKREAPAS